MGLDLIQAVAAYCDQYTNTSARNIVRCDRDWRFSPVDIIGAQAANYADADWRRLDIPHDYSIEGDFAESHAASGPGGWVQTGTVWYRKHLTADPSWQGRKIFLCFDGVSMNSQVWVNGHYLGHHPYAYTPFWYDITPFMQAAGENVIAVKADNSLQPFSRFYGGTGIYRPVWLVATDPLHITPWGVRAEVTHLDDARAAVTVNTELRVDRYPETDFDGFRDPAQNVDITKTCRVTNRIVDLQGALVAEVYEDVAMRNFSRRTVTQGLEIANPARWSPAQPSLYRLYTTLSIDGTVVDDGWTPLGVRTVAVDVERGFQLNGDTLKLKGLCLHQDAGLFGAAVPLEVWVRRITQVQAMGCNALRTSHHPFPPEFYHACDYLGMLVLDEAFDEWQKGWVWGERETPYSKSTYGYALYFAQWSETDLRAMLRRDYNHPSVVMWSVGNEIPEQYHPEGVEMVQRLVRITHEEDRTRPVTLGAEGNAKCPITPGFMEALDVQGYNYIDMRYGEAYYDPILQQQPGAVLLGSETGYDPIHWGEVTEHPSIIGQFLWVGYDYLGESPSTPDPAQPDRLLHGWTGGIIDTIDTPRAEFYLRQSLWTEQPMVHLAVKTATWQPRALWAPIPAAEHWNWTPGEEKTVYVFTNCERVELRLNGEVVGEQTRDPQQLLPLQFTVPYTPGTLQVVGYRQGKVVCEHALTTAKPAATLALECDYSRLPADGRAVAHLRIRAVDAHGVPVPDAAERVRVTVEGAGTLYGLATGDLATHTGYRATEVDLYQGQCLAVVQAADTAGALTVRVSADGLPPAQLVLPVQEG